MNKDNECYLSEIYSAIQGEGPLVGVRQIFLRFSVCDLKCVWCDTPDSLVREEFCQVETALGSRKFKKVKNSVSISELLSYIKGLTPDLHHSISLTGGEPLLQHKFLSAFLPLLREQIKANIYLETGGHRPDELRSVIKYIDYVSMDFKLPTSSKTGDLWEKHRQFLDIALSSESVLNIWVKIVTTNKTSKEELNYSVELIKSVNKNNKIIEVFLQPVSEINGSKPPSEKDLLNIQTELLKIYPYIRVVPQVHKLIGQK